MSMRVALAPQHRPRRCLAPLLSSGKGLKVAVFDTGLNPRQNYLRDVVEAVDFTPERNTADVCSLVGEVKTQSGR